MIRHVQEQYHLLRGQGLNPRDQVSGRLVRNSLLAWSNFSLFWAEEVEMYKIYKECWKIGRNFSLKSEKLLNLDL